MKATLVQIQEAISSRASAIMAQQTGWPCRAGCDHCCRHLAAIPELSEAEWTLLSEALPALPALVHHRILALEDASGSISCPLLELASGTCLVYEHRPLACRTYGFYIERGEGLYCDRIHSLAEAGQLDHVVWGSQASIVHSSAPLGQQRSLLDWFKSGFKPSD